MGRRAHRRRDRHRAGGARTRPARRIPGASGDCRAACRCEACRGHRLGPESTSRGAMRSPRISTRRTAISNSRPASMPTPPTTRPTSRSAITRCAKLYDSTKCCTTTDDRGGRTDTTSPSASSSSSTGIPTRSSNTVRSETGRGYPATGALLGEESLALAPRYDIQRYRRRGS